VRDPGRAVVTREDIDAAQEIVDAWAAARPSDAGPNVGLPMLRGLITQAIADAHAEGHDQGVQHGRRIVARAVRDALDGEGL
jgi:hypothetical protein